MHSPTLGNLPHTWVIKPATVSTSANDAKSVSKYSSNSSIGVRPLMMNEPSSLLLMMFSEFT